MIQIILSCLGYGLILWLLVFLVHYIFYIDKKTKDEGGFIFAIKFFFFCPYVVSKTIWMTYFKNKTKSRE